MTTTVETQQANSDNHSNSGSDVNGKCRSIDASCSCSADNMVRDYASNTSLVHSPMTKAAQVEPSPQAWILDSCVKVHAREYM